jgi:branched-chain amino acid transport system permease protein
LGSLGDHKVRFNRFFPTKKGTAIAAMVIILLILPVFIQDPYIMNIVILSLLFAVMACSWNVICGYTGIFTLSHQAFFGIGAYVSALLSMKLGLSPWFGLLSPY